MLNFFGAKKKPVAKHGPDRRTEARIDTTVNAEWRFKPVGKIASAWSKVVVSDLSRVSANMSADRDFKVQDIIEIRMTLDTPPPVIIDAAILRTEKTGSRFKVSFVFKHHDEESSHVITRYVNKRMTELRGRGLV